MSSLLTKDGTRVLVDQDVAENLSSRSLSVGSHGYAWFWNGRVMVLLHRLIMGMPMGIGHKAGIVDHIDGDILNNRRDNLRVIDGTRSNLNREVKGSGVYPHRNQWLAKVSHHGQSHHLGTYDTPEEAAAAVAIFREKNDIVHLRVP